MGSMTRGPLPPSIYWRRRLVVLVIAVALVVGITMLLRLGSDGDSGDNADDAAMAASEESSSAAASPSLEPSAEATDEPESSAPASTALPTPEGECTSDDVVIESSATGAYAFQPVTIQLRVRTAETAACTWDLDKDAIQVRLTREGRPLWSSVDCPRAVPTQQLTLYRDAATIVPMTWNGHRSDAGMCGPHAAWAQPGSYQIAVAAMGGEPSRAEFELLRPGEDESSEAPESSESSESGDPSGDDSESATTGESETTEDDQQRQRKRSGGGTDGDAADGTPTEGPRPGQRDEPTDLPD